MRRRRKSREDRLPAGSDASDASDASDGELPFEQPHNSPGSAAAGARATQRRDEFGEAVFDAGAAGGVFEKFEGGFGDGFRGSGVLDVFGENFFVGHHVRHGEPVYFYDALPDLVGEP